MRLDSVDRGRLIIAVVAVVALLAGLWWASRDDATSQPPAINGDMLGQVDESYDQYVERAADTLATAPEGEKAFGLVTFAEPLDAAQAGELTAELGRVNAMLVGFSAPMPLPEPVGGATRAEVYERQFGAVADSLAGIGNVPVPRELTAVIAWDEPEAFRALAGDGRVAAVEMLPPDAVWGDFGVRPVEVPGVDMLEVAAPTAG
ncbi:hypothetical protein [Corynebacterium doosanense]|uniref:Uncharacterized protein n=1 Tax=Corynebacterium doosanense CAU 212 = DSM 45436 TaxID=558173 RepID=A0A097IH31_9CORY|nr:hypothetical protein [Corynebacterium doosanense]AIT61440.1 hypothetical protein CDOO_09310 [Corynebacterium doosanense CAU 212 = DSM 45436]